MVPEKNRESTTFASDTGFIQSMQRIQRPLAGLQYTFISWVFITRNRCFSWFIFPTLVLLLMFWAGFETSRYFSEILHEYLRGHLSQWFGIAQTPDFLYYVFWILVRVSLFMLLTYIGGYVVLLLMAPYLSWISMRTEILLNGSENSVNRLNFVREVLYSVWITSRNMMLEILLSVLLFFLAFIPILTPFIPPVLFLITSWFYGFAFLQPVFERNQLNIRQSNQSARSNYGLVLGLGAQYTLLISIPFVGILLCAYAAVILTVAATLGMRKNYKSFLEQNLNRQKNN